MKAKPWQLAIVVLGLLVGIGSIVYMTATSERPVVNSIVYLVDVETGDLYQADLDKQAVPQPARHPQSKRLCLVRIVKDEKGVWVVRPRDRSLFKSLDKDVKIQAVNTETGELIAPAKKPIEYVAPRK